MKEPHVKILGITVLVALAACGKANYPACDGDDDCKAHNEICIDKKCVECAKDATCVSKLGAGASCQKNMCVAAVKPECSADSDCTSGGKCRNNKCGCEKDQECGDGRECTGGLCREKSKASNVSSAQCIDPQHPGKVALQTVHFDYDKAEIRADAQSTLDQDAECLKQAPAQKFTVEGHTDERGTVEYNLSLGESRSTTVVKYLDRLGAANGRLRVVSKGKAQPVCHDASEDCFGKNRRVEFK